MARIAGKAFCRRFSLMIADQKEKNVQRSDVELGDSLLNTGQSRRNKTRLSWTTRCAEDRRASSLLKHDQGSNTNAQNMYEGRVTDLEATTASLCACETLSGRASWAGRVRYISNNSSEVATHKRATPKTSRFSRAVFRGSLFLSFCNLMSK
jgi:hypothetical protein